MSHLNEQHIDTSIAIIGMAGRFPKARNITEYWQNIKEGRDCITHFTGKEAESMGFMPLDTSSRKFVGAVGELDDIDAFDARFFGYTPREAELIDPQQRIALECAWHCMEHGGYGDVSSDNRIGVFAGATLSTYLFGASLPRTSASGQFNVAITNDKDYVATRISHKLNLKGPSVVVQAACSTSLLAVHYACLSILTGESDMALAGGVSVKLPQRSGYIYHEGSINSPDGFCRAFDAAASGTVWGHGVGFVLLKPLRQALEDGDSIHAVICGSAVNNDGREKAAFTSPSVSGQYAVIREAHRTASITPQDVSLVEAHGTGTTTGDPVEVEALQRVFGNCKSEPYCVIGSVKPNIGHLDAAAGIAGLIKTVLSLQHRKIAASLNCEKPIPSLTRSGSSFFVNSCLRDWEPRNGRRIAGVSAFGVGGTNVHVIVEESPIRQPSSNLQASNPQLIPISARTQEALDRLLDSWEEFLSVDERISLPDVSWTAQKGRLSFDYRTCLSGRNIDELLESLKKVRGRTRNRSLIKSPKLTFLFPGQGTQYAGMGEQCFRSFIAFRKTFDDFSKSVFAEIGLDLKKELWGQNASISAKIPINSPILAQLALVAVQCALADQYVNVGIYPKAVLGHSLGEFAAAYTAGVYTLDEIARLVCKRAQLVERLPEGRMMTVQSATDDIRQILPTSVSVAAVNSPQWLTVSGPPEEIEAIEGVLLSKGVVCRRLSATRAYHSSMLDPILNEFEEFASQFTARHPKNSWISNLTGREISSNEFGHPGYWSRQMRATVEFDAGVNELIQSSYNICLEIGPGRSLSALLHGRNSEVTLKAVAALHLSREFSSEDHSVLAAIAALWEAGIHVNWTNLLNDPSRRRRVPVPQYLFDRTRYWLKPAQPTDRNQAARQAGNFSPFHRAVWKRDLRRNLVELQRIPSAVVLFCDTYGLGDEIGQQLQEKNSCVYKVFLGDTFEQESEFSYRIRPHELEDYERLFESISENGVPAVSIHLWSIDDRLCGTEKSDDAVRLALDSLAFWAQVIRKCDIQEHHAILTVTSGSWDIIGGDFRSPLSALVRGPVLVGPLELGRVGFKHLDVDFRFPGTPVKTLCDTASIVLRELDNSLTDNTIAYRNTHRWILSYERARLTANETSPYRKNGVYLITGGTGGIGLSLAAQLAQEWEANLFLVSRTSYPELENSGDTADELLTPERSAIIQKLRQIKQRAGSLTLRAVDVSDAQQMQTLVNEIIEIHGHLHGVFHLAGVPGLDSILLGRESRVDNPVIRAKVFGTEHLLSSLRELNLDFLVLCSSLSSAAPTMGQVAYASANSYLDAMACYHHAQCQFPVVSVGWDMWRDVGMVHRIASELISSGSLIEQGIDSGSALKWLEQAITSGSPHWIVAHDEIVSRREAEAARIAKAIKPGQLAKDEPQDYYPRPHMSVPYDPPATDMEKLLERAWRECTRVETIGRNDNFFELGGDSLLAAQLVAEIQKISSKDMPLSAVFEFPTLAAQAELLVQGIDSLERNPTIADKVLGAM